MSNISLVSFCCAAYILLTSGHYKSGVALKSALFKNPLVQQQFDTLGYVVIDFLDAAQTAAVTQKFYELHPTVPQGFYSAAFNASEQFRQNIFEHTDRIVTPVLQQHFKDYKKLGSTFLCKSSNEGVKEIHQDWTVVDESLYTSATIWIPLCDTTVQNGALCAIPGSHTWFNNLRSPNLTFPFHGHEETLWPYMQPACMQAGQAFVLNHAIIHGSFPNTTNSERPVLAYGIVPAQAPLRFYHRQPQAADTMVEQFDMPDDFFQQYHNIGQRPLFGKLVQTFAYNDAVLTPAQIQQVLQQHAPPKAVIPAQNTGSLLHKKTGLLHKIWNRLTKPMAAHE